MTEWLTRAETGWFAILWVCFEVVVSLTASAHAVLTKRQVRAAVGWIGLIWVAPYCLGSLLYLLLGINRVRRKARTMRRRMRRSVSSEDLVCTPDELREVLGPDFPQLLSLARLSSQVGARPLMEANEILPLRDGDEAYPAMLRAIEEAERSVSLTTYIFYDDPTGRRFVGALGRAVGRGVEVRVLIDDVGARYGWPRRSTIVDPLVTAGVTVDTFIPTFAPARMTYFNMRNHRKILVADGRLALTGGMNIDETFLHGNADGHPRHHDLHFQVRGPVVADLQRVFAEDWEFTNGERLEGPAWFPPMERVGPTPARCVPDGPDEQVDRILTTILGAVSCARTSIAIITPYFLPDEPLLSALEVAALRGVEVDILLPEKTNVRLVQWAMTPFLERVMEGGCRVWHTPPPFDHTKLMVVDHAWSLIGSANLDPRSLRLNFEVNLECYGTPLAEKVEWIYLDKKQNAREITLPDLRSRSLPVRLRDGVARLFSPYL
jgi:cardiolipin synthase